MEKITVGIDVSKDHLDVAVRPSGEQFAVPRTSAGLGGLVARVKVLKPNVIVIEATGAAPLVVGNSPVSTYELAVVSRIHHWAARATRHGSSPFCLRQLVASIVL
jgi:hypothetical protein